MPANRLFQPYYHPHIVCIRPFDFQTHFRNAMLTASGCFFENSRQHQGGLPKPGNLRRAQSGRCTWSHRSFFIILRKRRTCKREPSCSRYGQKTLGNKCHVHMSFAVECQRQGKLPVQNRPTNPAVNALQLSMSAESARLCHGQKEVGGVWALSQLRWYFAPHGSLQCRLRACQATSLPAKRQAVEL